MNNNEILIKRYIKLLIEGSKFITYDPSDINAKRMNQDISPKIKFVEYDLKNIKEYDDMLLKIAGPDIFITFSDSYEIDPTTSEDLPPKFSMNPKAAFGTPHGFYFYPFDKNNVKNFIEYGAPASADFATDRKFFHLIKVDLNHPNVLIIEKDGKTNKRMNRKIFDNNVNEIARILIHYSNVIDDINMDYVLLSKEYDFDYEPVDEKLVIEDIRKELYHIINSELMDKLLTHVIPFFKHNYNVENIKNNEYIILYKLCLILTTHISDLINYLWKQPYKTNAFITKMLQLIEQQDNHNLSELYALLLNTIGIKCIIDKGVGVIHENEPEQMHILTFGEDDSFYKYIGTYNNYHTDEISEYLDFLKNEQRMNKNKKI
jgi:hypothetical protein